MDKHNPRKRSAERERLSKPPTRRAPKPKKDGSQGRRAKFTLFFIGFIACLLYLSWQILAIKNDKGTEYELTALRQLVERSTGDKAILPNRGAIMDRNKQALAISTTVYDIVLDVRTILHFENDMAQERYQALSAEEKANSLANQQKTLEIIHRVLGVEHGIDGLDMTTLQGYLAIDTATSRPTRDTFYLIIAQNVPRKAATALTAALAEENLRHVYADEDTERRYVYDNLASSVLGFIRGDSNWGLERQYGAELTGVPGRVFNAFGDNGSVQAERVEPIEGHTIVTTLDLAIQQYAERVCEKYAEIYHAPYASAIVMDPYTAELYALAQYPSVNLNAPADVSFINKDEYARDWANLPMDELIHKLNSLWANFNLTSTFEPGSIYKPLTVAAALEEGVIRTDQTFYCNGERWYGETRIPCHKTDGHGWQTLEQALANSCNVAMMEIADTLGRESFYNYRNDFGYSDRTGIDLPAEGFGVIHPYSNFHTTELATASFGQRFTCTALQAITSFCATINGGNIMRPYIVSQVVDERGYIIAENKPLVQRKVISQETSDYLRTAMESVISPNGTGWRAVIDGWAIGGKTATGEQGIKGTDDYSYSISFITYFPVEKPQYAVLVLLHQISEEEYDNGATPGNMAKELMLDIIKYKAIPPSYDVGDVGLMSNDMLIIEDYTGQSITEVTRGLNRLSMDYEIVGGSCAVVTGQFPSGGSRIPKGSTVILTTGPQDGVTLTEVPNVVGLDISQAEALLTAAGFGPFVVYPEAEATPASGAPADSSDTTETPPALPQVILTQSPEAGVRAMPGTEVRLKIE